MTLRATLLASTCVPVATPYRQPDGVTSTATPDEQVRIVATMHSFFAASWAAETASDLRRLWWGVGE